MKLIIFIIKESRFIGIKLCKSTEKYNITILHEEVCLSLEKVVVDFEVTFAIAVTKSDQI